jgi:hypothetical protein
LAKNDSVPEANTCPPENGEGQKNPNAKKEGTTSKKREKVMTAFTSAVQRVHEEVEKPLSR